MYDEYTHLELENRIKNLMWTVSEDYALDVEPDIRSFSKSKYISLYDAVKQGAFAKYFDVDTFGMYLLKKVYLGAEEGPLVNIAQLCIDSAVWRRVSEERIGVPDIRIHAFSDILEYDFHKMTATLVGQVKIAILRDAVTGHHSGEQRLRKYTDIIHSLEDAETTMEIICAADTLYNIMIDPDFEKMHGDLQKVLSVTTSELRDSNWQDLLDEDVQSQLEQMQRQMMNAANRMNEEEEEKERRAGGVIYLDEESIAKMYSYIELNYGRSYLNEQEQKRINHKVCRGPHADCSLFFTDGILSNMVKVNSQSEYAKRTKEVNLRVLSQHRRVTMRNIAIMTDILKRALVLRNDEEQRSSEYGTIVPNKLWRVGRTSDTKLFTRVNRCDNSEFVVDILIDASGSQRARQSQVALQAYIISEALSNVCIPHRVMSFCTFWDYTVMRRFREYDEDRSANERIFEFYASSNNRDGLAVNAAADGLNARPEENKILIILSDGRPNDIIVNRPNSKNPTPYFGDYAVRDTALSIRKLRNEGVAVLGVFAGEEQDLAAERKIFGKDFAYIRDIGNFANIVGAYLKKQLSE